MIGQAPFSVQGTDYLEWKQIDFAELLALYRKQRGFSREQLARASQLSRVYLYHLERGQRNNPSPQVVRRLAQALALEARERDQFYRAYTRLTGNWMETFQDDEMLLGPNVLIESFVYSSPYPTHTLDPLWFISACNDAAALLFDLTGTAEQSVPRHMLEWLFTPSTRQHLRDFEQVARRLVNDFCVLTQSLAHLPAYKALWQRLQTQPDFARLAATSPLCWETVTPLRIRVQHSRLGPLTLRAIATHALLEKSQWMISYLPDDQQTLDCYRRQAWYQRSGAIAPAYSLSR